MSNVRVTNTATGETKVYTDAVMMVASNGTIFIKKAGKTVFASASDFIIVEVE